MAFCAICGRYHEQGVSCFDGTGEMLREAGVSAPPEPSKAKEGFDQIARKADRWFLKVLLWALAIIVLLFVLFSLIKP